MRILFNCVVNVKGGAVQNAANFISLARLDRRNTFRFLVSKSVYEILESWGDLDESISVVAHPLSDRRVQQVVSEIETQFGPDVVYTMAGPSYLRFRKTHVLGLSDAYTTHAKIKDFFYNRTTFDGLKHLLKCFLKGIWARMEGDFFIFQTETSMNGFGQRYFLNRSRAKVIPNSLGRSFLMSKPVCGARKIAEAKELRILCPAADYPHKDLFIIERIAEQIGNHPSYLKFPRLSFIVTVDESSEFAQSLESLNRITSRVSVTNRGPFSYADALDVYSDCDIVFMPSVLETFSTSYLEALACGKALVVADKEFSREICLDAAYYFREKDASSFLRVLQMGLNTGFTVDQETVFRVLERYGDYEKRYSSILNAILEFSKISSRGVDNV